MKSCQVPILVRGDAVSFELEDGGVIELPEDWGLFHDPSGKCFQRCEIRIGKYNLRGRSNGELPHSFNSIATEYLGSDEDLFEGTVEIPNGPWQHAGRVVRIYYARYGTLKGYYQHPFEDPIPLYRQTDGKGYKLVLPDRCVINSHGFVWP